VRPGTNKPRLTPRKGIWARCPLGSFPNEMRASASWPRRGRICVVSESPAVALARYNRPNQAPGVINAKLARTGGSSPLAMSRSLRAARQATRGDRAAAHVGASGLSANIREYGHVVGRIGNQWLRDRG